MKKKMTTMNVFSVWNCKNAQINDLNIFDIMSSLAYAFLMLTTFVNVTVHSRPTLFSFFEKAGI